MDITIVSAEKYEVHGVTVRVADRVELLVPVMVTGKVAVVALAATVTLAGTVGADVLLLVSVTTAPPAGAGPLNVTVPVEGLPPTTLVGFSVT